MRRSVHARYHGIAFLLYGACAEGCGSGSVSGDLHGEATSEKIAFTYAFSGRAQVVVGTHTHVQTADERIVNGTGCHQRSGHVRRLYQRAGADVKEIVTRFTTEEKTRYTIAEGPGIFCGVIVNIDEQTCRAHSIERIQIRPEQEERFSLQ
ncbi:MAG: YmdB family metallophosphoesterase [Merdibacter sp.]